MVLLAETLQVSHRDIRYNLRLAASAGAQNLELSEVAHTVSPGIVFGSAPADSDSIDYRNRRQIYGALRAHLRRRQRPALDPASHVQD
jgi:hypothetical protein